jgi:hypothetical protein
MTMEMTRPNGAEIRRSGQTLPVLITEEHRNILRAMVDRNATPAQIEMLIVVGNRYDLDPLMGHVVLISGKCFVTHKGLMHKAHASKVFDGIEVAYGRDDQGDFCECHVYRKDMTRPFVNRIYIDEYRAATKNPVWQQFPRAMAAKTAESFVLRRAFDVSLTSQEEISVGDLPSALPSHPDAAPDSFPPKTTPAQASAAYEKNDAPNSEELLRRKRREKTQEIVAVMAASDDENRAGWLDRFESKWGISDVKNLSLGQIKESLLALGSGDWPYEDEYQAKQDATAPLLAVRQVAEKGHEA